MRQSGKCPKCSSQDIHANATVLDRGVESPADQEIVVYEKPEAFLFKSEQVRYTVRAWACKGCGYTELYCL